MHQYLRAIGFTDPPKRKDIYNFIKEGIEKPTYRAYTTSDTDEDSLLAQYEIEVGPGMGICVCGQFDEGDEFFPEYYYPYLDAERISTTEETTIEKRVDNDSYAGVCDDLRVGLTMIFRLRNSIEYLKNTHVSFAPMESTSVSLSALSLKGSVLLPIYKTDSDRRNQKNTAIKRRRLMNAARSGDEDAMKDLTVADMDTYANILSHIQYEDVYSMVESYFMPYGSECELYSVLGEIRDFTIRKNKITNEDIVVMNLDCNGLLFNVGINRKDLYGEPAAGRRFKGSIWLMGRVNFPTDVFALEKKHLSE